MTERLAVCPPKGQRVHSPGYAPGYVLFNHPIALNGQKRIHPQMTRFLSNASHDEEELLPIQGDRLSKMTSYQDRCPWLCTRWACSGMTCITRRQNLYHKAAVRTYLCIKIRISTPRK